MEVKSDMNPNQEPIIKKASNNFTINEDLKENNISEIPPINKIFSNTNSIIMPNVILFLYIIKF
jgi:hypothetical protein